MSIAPFVYAGDMGFVIAIVTPPPPSPPSAPPGPSPLDGAPSRGEHTPVFESQSKPLRPPAGRVGHPETPTTRAIQASGSRESRIVHSGDRSGTPSLVYWT